MKGIFIGEDSCGFIKGKIYNLTIAIEYINNIWCICLQSKKAWCPYTSLENVMKNWIFQ